ncbi:MAG: DNA-binding protein [Cryobacterium sp.]
MFVITADQIGSRHDRDRAGEMIAQLTAGFGAGYVLPPDQTSGDEIQVMMTHARTALGTVLALHRSGYWAIGLGLGPVRTPYPPATRQAAGGAFIAARDAVSRAKRADSRFALVVAPAALHGAPRAHTGLPSPGAASPQAVSPQGLLPGDSVPGAFSPDGDDADEQAGDASVLEPGVEPGVDPRSGQGELDAHEVEALISLLLLLRHRRSPEGWEATDLLEQGLPQVEIAGILGISTAAVSQRVKSALWRADEAARPALVRLLGNLDRATSETDPA